MPSPLGHALAGFAAGWLVTGPPIVGDSSVPDSHGRRVARRALAFAAVGMAADLDLLLGRHSQFTHSISMALAAGVLTAAWLRAWHAARRTGKVPGRTRHLAVGMRHGLLLAAGVAAAYGSHILLDWLAQDATPPLGITALWPFRSAYYLSGLDVFWGISREPWRPGAAWHDVVAISREVLLLGPLAGGAWWLRRPRAWQILPARSAAGRQPLPACQELTGDSESR